MNAPGTTFSPKRIGMLVSLSISVFSTNFLDPINWPKQIALLMLTSYLCFEVISSINVFEVQHRKNLIKLLSSVSILALSATFNSENLTRLLWGIWGRNNGLLTQIALFCMAYAFYVFSNRRNFTIGYLQGISMGMFPASIYGLIQVFKLDWVNWSNKDQVFSFFGNSNFASSIFAIVSAVCLCLFFLDRRNQAIRSFYLFHGILSAFIAWQTKSIQGIVALLLGLVILLAKLSINKFKLPSKSSFIALFVLGLLTIYGFLGKGLFSFLYQYTFELRSFYWLVGLKMGANSPWFGVGIDSFGDYYRFFRPLHVAQTTTVDLTVNNAHNSIIQIFATLGFFGLFSILVWLIPALSLSIRQLVSVHEINLEKLSISILFLMSFAISMISIDNIAVATLYWSILGIVLGTLGKASTFSSESAKISPISRVLVNTRSILLPLLVGSVFAVSWFASTADRKLLEIFSQTISANDNAAINNRWASLKQLADNDAFLQEAQLSYIVEGIDKTQVWTVALEVAKNGLEKYPIDFSLLDKAAVLGEKSGKFEEAEVLRKEQLAQDPRHSLLWLYLARDLYEQNKLEDAKSALLTAKKYETLLDSNGKNYLSSLERKLNE